MLPDAPQPLGPLEEIARKIDEFNKRLSHLERLEGAGGAWTLIETIELGVATASIDFQNIPQTFRHLAILAELRTDRDATAEEIRTNYNNDSANNYDSFDVRFTHPSVETTGPRIADAFIVIGSSPANSTPSNYFGVFHIWIPVYRGTDFFKTQISDCFSLVAQNNTNLRRHVSGGTWRDTSAITRVTIAPVGANDFVADSTASLYGISG